MQILILTESDIELLADDALILGAVEEAFRLAGLGQTQMPAKTYLAFPEFHGDLRTMPAYLPTLQAAGVKVVNSHPQNPKCGLPTVMAVIILNDPSTGRPFSMMAASTLTALRTGAAGALAAKLLAKPDIESAGFIGGGTQARHQLRFLMQVRPIAVIRVYDVDPSKAESFCEHARWLGVSEVRAVSTAAEAAGEPIVVTTTPGGGPVCDVSAFKPGAHINAIGADAPGKQELPAELLTRAKVIVDHRGQASHSGEINVPIQKGLFRPDQIHAELGEIVAGKIPGRVSADEITIFDSTGLAIQDIAVAKRIHDRAIEQQAGQRVNLGGA